jgi:uncharacterized protein (TIGR02246 family)
MDAIEKLIEDEFKAANAGDNEALLNLRTADAVEIFPGSSPLVGKEAIRAAWNQVADISEQFTDRSVEEINLAGDWASIRFSFTHTVTQVVGGESRVSHCQGLWVIRRQSDSSWKIHWEMTNSSDPQD